MPYNAIIKPLLLREVSASDFSYPVVAACVLLAALGVLTGLDPQMGEVPLPNRMIMGLVTTAAAFAVITLFMRWWLKRGQRWQGEGPLFRLIVAASAIDLLTGGLTALGVPGLFILPLFLYSIWVAAHAMESAFGVSLRYSIAGILLSFIPIMLAVMGVSALLMFVGVLPMPTVPPVYTP